MAKRKRWLRKMSAPAARVQSKVGWESGIEEAHNLMEEILAGRIGADDVDGIPHMPRTKGEVEPFVDAVFDRMNFNAMASNRYDQGWNITDVRVEVFAMGTELARLLEVEVAKHRWG